MDEEQERVGGAASMSGAFQTSREIFGSPIWKNIVDFRMFFLIYGNAVYSEDGVRVAEDLFLKRGEWCRSTRKLQEDLQYIENRQVKTYSTSVINRCIKRLIDLQMVCTRTHQLGTVFTVVNYERYQGFSNYSKKELGTELGTLGEHSGNNNKKEKKEKKESKTFYAEFVSLTETEYQKLEDQHGEENVKRMIAVLDNYKGSNGKKYASDYRAILNWVVERVMGKEAPKQKDKAVAARNKDIEFQRWVEEGNDPDGFDWR